jgi:hypothetical protein
MFKELNRELINAKEKLWRKQKLENLISQTREAWQKELDRKKELEDILQDEDKDVKKLESISIANIFYTILGSKEKQLEKERQELLSAKLKYEECCKSVLVLEKELASHKDSLNSVINASYEYEAALKRKEEFILQLNNDSSQKLHQLMDNIANLEAQKKELTEAITSGKAVKIELRNVMNSLESAKGWGTWDMLGGGLLADIAKHSRIDEAKKYVHHAKTSLMRFKNELSDVELTTNIDINIGSFEKFADYFFDGLIADWVVQSRIKESLDSVQRVASNVESVLDLLIEKSSSIQNNLIEAEKNIKLIIEEI